MDRIVGVLVISLLICLSESARQSAAQSKALRSRQIGTESQILGRLFSTGEYDPHSRPPVRDSADHPAIVVITSVYINRIVWNKHSTAEVDLYLRQQWEDSRLTYEIDPREGIHEVVLPKNRPIWKPDTFFIGAEEDVDADAQQLRSRIVIEPSGYVRSSEKRTLTVNVDQSESGLMLSDKKSIKLKLSSYNYPIEDIVYLWANSPPNVLPVEVSTDLLDDSSQYSFLDASAGDCVGNYTVGVYSCINVSVTFKGSAMGGFMKLFFPCILLVVASWLHFWIHGSWSVPRTISAAVPFFILVAVLFLIPPPTKAMLVWLVLCVIITFCSFVEYFLVICCGIHQRVRYTNGLLHTTNPSAVHSTPITIHDEDQRHAYQHQQQPPHDSVVITKGPLEVEQKANCTRLNNNIDLIARVAFPIVFLIFIVVFLLFFSF